MKLYFKVNFSYIYHNWQKHDAEEKLIEVDPTNGIFEGCDDLLKVRGVIENFLIKPNSKVIVNNIEYMRSLDIENPIDY